jgi:DNA repair exonuclease SbcCD ATPase subunit
MNTVESLGYLKGLIEGLDLDEDKKETKIFKAIVEVIDNIVLDIDDVNEELDDIAEQVEAIDEDLGDIEDFLAGESYVDDLGDIEDDFGDYEVYGVTCPACGADIDVDEDTVMQGKMECPVCGEILEFEIDEDEE